MKSLVLSVLSAAAIAVVATAAPAQTPPSRRYGLIIADPPYSQLDPDTLDRLATFLTPGGVLAVSHGSKLNSPMLESVELVKYKVYGDTALSFYK